MKIALILTLTISTIQPSSAQHSAGPAKFEFWPATAYDASIPAFRKVLGYDPGERISSHANLMRYMEALAGAAPSRMKIFEYAKSWEGRKLIYAAVGSEANIRRLDEVRAGMKRLADPRRTPDAISSLPAVIWLGYGVHGNEISSPDAALLTAYHLLAARNDKLVSDVLANVVVLIDPTQNPDGRDRFVHNFEQAEGIEPDASPIAAEHNEPWPGGRTNHYLFDLNRDWFALTQPETRGRVKALQEWYPLVFVDLHEMGSDSTYYFAPEAVPYNPHLAKDQRDSLEWFGRNNARWFDRFGFSYFTREVFDAFYPGYGASWPSYYGSVAMTYEQASARGLLMRRSDDSIFHFRDTVRQHFVASLSTAEASAANREKLLQNFYRYRQSAIEEGSKEAVRAFVLPRRGDTSVVDKLAHILAEQGVEVTRAAGEFQSAGKSYPAGSYVISLAQPAKRLIRTLLDTNVPMDDSFVKEQEDRRRRKLPDQIYDVVAWSLPLQYGVEAIGLAEVPAVTAEAIEAGKLPTGKVNGGNATVAYLAPWGSAAAGRFLAAALREGLSIWSTDKPFSQNGKKYSAGTLILKVKENPASLHTTVQRLAASSGADIEATGTGWVDDGVNFGSGYVVRLRRPAIALAWDVPASPAVGHTRFVLERQFNYPVTPVRTMRLGGIDLSRFHVLILPDSSGYGTALGLPAMTRIKDWVNSGGTLIAIGGAIASLADPKTGLLAVTQENVARPAETPKKPEPATEVRAPGKILATEEEYRKAIQAETELPDTVPGVLAKAKLEPDHWLTAGLLENVYALVRGNAIFSPIKQDKGVNAAVFAGPSELLASGYLWEENRKQLAFKPLLIAQRHGRGWVLGFTADPNYRAYMDGLNLLFLNAVFRAPARTTAAGEEK